MDEKILAIYCLCADFLQALGHAEAPQQKMSDAEVITTALVAVLFFRGNFEAARALLGAPWYMLHMLSRSRLKRRLHHLNELFVTLFELLGHTWKHLNTESVYILDSFPIAVCDNYRIPRAKLTGMKSIGGTFPARNAILWAQNPSPSCQRWSADRMLPDARVVQ